MPDLTRVNRPEAKSTLTEFFHDTPSSLKKRQRECEDKQNNAAEENSMKERPSKRSRVAHQDGEYNGQNGRKKIARIQASQPTTGTWAPIQLTEYIAKVNKWAWDKDPNDSQLTRARESFLARIDDSVKGQAQEEYGLADVNGVGFLCGIGHAGRAQRADRRLVYRSEDCEDEDRHFRVCIGGFRSERAVYSGSSGKTRKVGQASADQR